MQSHIIYNNIAIFQIQIIDILDASYIKLLKILHVCRFQFFYQYMVKVLIINHIIVIIIISYKKMNYHGFNSFKNAISSTLVAIGGKL